MRICIDEWSLDWVAQFQSRAAAIRTALGAGALRIDHIGSTSVPGLAAKPIIDIQVSVSGFEDMARFTIPMATIGYVWRKDNPILTRRYFRERPGDRRTHIHLRRSGSWNEQWTLLFRDYMRSHPEEHEPYAALKRQLAERFQTDTMGYTEAKGDHLWSVIRRADLWAGELGWTPGPSDA